MTEDAATAGAETESGQVTTTPDERFVDRVATRWSEVRDAEPTVAILGALGLMLFPWFFIEFPKMVGIPSGYAGYEGLATLIVIWGIFALGFNLLLGYTGLLSFGHAAFWGAAAYATGLFSVHVMDAPLAMVLAGTLTAVVLAAIIGWLSLRRGGIYFAILTLAFGQMMYYMFVSPLSEWTNGENGFTGVQLGDLFGVINFREHLPWIFHDLMGNYLYLFTAFFGLLALVFAYRVLNSPYGLILRAIHQNERRTAFVGLHVWRYKFVAFIISGGFAGLAGSLFTIHGRYVPIDSLWWTTSGDIVIMTVLGGTSSFFGPVLGAAVYLYVENIISGAPVIGPLWHLILGLVFVVVVVTFKDGLWGLVERFREIASAALLRGGRAIEDAVTDSGGEQ